MPRLEHKYHVLLTDDAELESITRMHTVGAAKLRREDSVDVRRWLHGHGDFR